MTRKKKRGTARKRASPTVASSPDSLAPGAPSRARLYDAAAVGGVIVVALVAYANAVGTVFVYDDYGSIVENPSVHWREVSLDNARAAWLRSPTRRVVANLSFGLNHRFSGLDARSYHATNVAIHVATSGLVTLLLLHLLRRTNAGRGIADGASLRVAAAIGAAVFAAHPVGTQAVTYVVQRMASLAAFFCVGSLLLYVRGRGAAGARRVAYWLGSAIAWGLAIGSKESAATFPAVIALYEWIFQRGADRRVALRLAAVVGVAAAASLSLMTFNYGDPFRDTFYHEFGLTDRLLSQPRVLAWYAGLIAWPAPSRLSLFHDFVPSRGLFTPWTTLPAIALLVAVSVRALLAVERWPLLVFALGWWGLALAVETSVFPLRLAHEHRLYLPLVGLAIAVAEIVRRQLPHRRALVLGAACIVIALLVAATHVRNRVWQRRADLWADVIEKSPGEGIGYANLAATHFEAGRYAEALEWLERGRTLAPDYAGIPRGIGMVHAARGEFAEAVPLLKRGIAIDPLDHTAIGQLGVVLVSLGRVEESLPYFEESTRIFEHPRVLNHHGKALARLGRYRKAIPLHRRALALAPDDGYVHIALGVALAAIGSGDEARPLLERALSLDDAAGAHIALANLDWWTGRLATAQQHLRAALSLQPGSSLARNNLAWMLATAADPSLRDAPGALALVERAEAEQGEIDAELLDTRAAAEASGGRFEQALASALRAAELARTEGDEPLARDIEQRAELYRAGQLYIDPVSTGGPR